PKGFGLVLLHLGNPRVCPASFTGEFFEFVFFVDEWFHGESLLLNGNKVIKVSRPLEVFFFTAKTRRRGVAERVVEGPLGVHFDEIRDRGVGVSECERGMFGALGM